MSRRPSRARKSRPAPPGRATDPEMLATSGDATLDWLWSQARRAVAQGRLDDAVPLLERLVGLTREPHAGAEAHMLLGEILRTREDWNRSLQSFKAAAALRPDCARAWHQVGLAHAQQENCRAAVEALQVAARIDPDEPAIARALGVALGALGDDLEAERWLRRALALSPDSLEAMESIATHHMKMGRFAECGALLERASRLFPDNPMVRRLSKETAYLVELAAQGPAEAPPPPERRPLRVVLTGAAGEVERRFVESLTRRGFMPIQIAHARDAWRDYLAAKPVRVRQAGEHAAALEYVIARLDFVDGSARDEVASRHGVDAQAVARIHEDIVATLGIEMFDPRYCSQPHPARHVGDEADRSGLPPEDVFQALLEDEYREYLALHDRSASTLPRFEREEFEDASVEYGSLLTRELMGLTLARRDRRRKRELERLLLVT
jgi:Flp pilus assembly protein TadD